MGEAEGYTLIEDLIDDFKSNASEENSNIKTIKKSKKSKISNNIVSNLMSKQLVLVFIVILLSNYITVNGVLKGNISSNNIVVILVSIVSSIIYLLLSRII